MGNSEKVYGNPNAKGNLEKVGVIFWKFYSDQGGINSPNDY